MSDLTRRARSDAEFLAAATAVVNDLEAELTRAKPEESARWRALEIGCGSGRLMRPMSRHFLEIYGFDTDADLIAQARENLRDLTNARVRPAQAGGLADLDAESFDFVYSSDFFPHLSSRDAVLDFLREIQRVLRIGGLARLELDGTSFTSHDLLEFAQTSNFQVFALDGASTPSAWTTWKKQPAGWARRAAELIDAPGVARPAMIRRITNASSFEPAAPCRGRYASIALRVENLPPEADLNHLRVTIGSSLGTVTSIGPPDRSGCQQVRADLPELEATGLLPVQLFWLEQPLSDPATLRVLPPGPLVPRVVSAPRRVENRIVSLTLEEISRPFEIEVSVDGHPSEDLEKLCTAPRAQRYEVRFRLPEEVGPGLHHIAVSMGRRKLAPVPVEVA